MESKIKLIKLEEIDTNKITYTNESILYEEKPFILNLVDLEHCYYNDKFKPIINIMLDSKDTDERIKKLYTILESLDKQINTNNKLKYLGFIKSYEKNGMTHELMKVNISPKCKVYDENKKVLEKPDYKDKDMSLIISFGKLFKVSKTYGISTKVNQIMIKPKKDKFNDVCLFD